MIFQIKGNSFEKFGFSDKVVQHAEYWRAMNLIISNPLRAQDTSSTDLRLPSNMRVYQKSKEMLCSEQI